MEGPHDLAWKTTPSGRDVALSDAESWALLGLSYFKPYPEHRLMNRLKVDEAAIEGLAAKGLVVRRLDGEIGDETVTLVLTVAGARRRRARAMAMDADPSQQGWRGTMAAALGPRDVL